MFTYKQKLPLSTVEVLAEVRAVVLLVLQLIAPCWGQIGPLTKVPFSLFEGIESHEPGLQQDGLP